MVNDMVRAKTPENAIKTFKRKHPGTKNPQIKSSYKLYARRDRSFTEYPTEFSMFYIEGEN